MPFLTLSQFHQNSKQKWRKTLLPLHQETSSDFVHHVLDPLVVGEVDHVLWNTKITVWGEVVRVPRQGDNTGMAL
jgi:hypothetical protein